jgi:hypothetical protein
MNGTHRIVLCGLVSGVLCLSPAAEPGRTATPIADAPPVETFILQPIALDNVGLWVPADRSGPVINHSCSPWKNCVYSCLLPAQVRHTKTRDCPDGQARLLAEYAARFHEQSLPLTIFNGWQWEYSYSLCQYESALYDLDARGGSWETSLEAVLTSTQGRIAGAWIQIPPPRGVAASLRRDREQSSLTVTTFNSVRTRDGYPKKRNL